MTVRKFQEAEKVQGGGDDQAKLVCYLKKRVCERKDVVRVLSEGDQEGQSRKWSEIGG